MITEVTSPENFQNIIESHPQVLMEFFADWCPHCQAFQPVLEAASSELEANGIFVAQVDYVKFPDLFSEYGVESFPTMVFFQNGQPIASTSGERPEQAVFEWVNQVLNQE